MCYRPANTVTIVKCLECGAFNKPTNETCQKCGADLNESRGPFSGRSQGDLPQAAGPRRCPQGPGRSCSPKSAGCPEAAGELTMPCPAAYSACFRMR